MQTAADARKSTGPVSGLATARRVSTVAVGTVVGQGTVVLATPLLARLYSPAQFGELALYLTVAAYAAAGACLRYDLALASAKDDEAPALFWLCAICALGVGVLVGLVALLPWGAWSGSALTALADRPLLLAATVVVVGWNQGVASALVQAAQFTRLALMKAAQGLLFAGVALLSIFGLVLAVPASYAGASALAIRAVRKPSLAGIAAAAARHRSFPALSLPGALFDVLACSAVVLVISASYGIAELGHFSQIQRFLGAPLLLVSASLFQVFLRLSADEHQAGRPLAPLLRRIGSRVAMLVVTALVVVLLAGETILGLLLGPEWRVDRYFLLTVVGALAVRVAVSPFSSVLFTTGRLRTLFGWQLAYFAASFSVLPFAASRLALDGFLAVYLVHEIVLYGVYMGLIVHAARDAASD